MLDKITHIDVNGVKYPMCFNLNVMEEIQEQYGSIANWGNIVDSEGEPKIKDLKNGIIAMINEGIDIENETAETKRALLTQKQVGRLLSGLGLKDVTEKIKSLTIDSISTGDEPKNE